MKIIKILIISLFIITMLSTNIYASGLGNIIDIGEAWEDTGKQHANTTMDTQVLMETSSKLYDMFMSVALVVAIFVGAFLGIKYMSAGVSEKVQVKETLFPYIVSCIVVFGSLGIWKLGVVILGAI